MKQLDFGSISIKYGEFEVNEPFKRLQITLIGIAGDEALLREQCLSSGLKFIWAGEGQLVVEK